MVTIMSFDDVAERMKQRQQASQLPVSVKAIDDVVDIYAVVAETVGSPPSASSRLRSILLGTLGFFLILPGGGLLLLNRLDVIVGIEFLVSAIAAIFLGAVLLIQSDIFGD